MPSFKLSTDQTVKRLRWLMLAVILFDNLNTLFGQSSGYWQHPETVQEGNRLTHIFISRGWVPFCLYEVVYMAVAFFLASLPLRRVALVVSMSFILGHYYGASTWLAHRWQLGTTGTVIYGILLAVVFVGLAFPSQRRGEAQARGGHV